MTARTLLTQLRRRWFCAETTAERVTREANEDYERFVAEIRVGGWSEWMDCRPTHGPVEVRRFEWPETRIFEDVKLHPLMNVAGLYWRYNTRMTIDGVAEPVMLTICADEPL